MYLSDFKILKKVEDCQNGPAGEANAEAKDPTYLDKELIKKQHLFSR